MMYGAIEAGGTKFVCAVMTAPTRIVAEHVIATTTPEETLANVVHFFEGAERAHGPLHSFGIASFGPVQVLHTSPRWGRLLAGGGSSELRIQRGAGRTPEIGPPIP